MIGIAAAIGVVATGRDRALVIEQHRVDRHRPVLVQRRGCRAHCGKLS
jgi:hypothetical protein